MKGLRKLLAMLMAAVLLLSVSAMAYAEGPEDEIKIYTVCVDESGAQLPGTEKQEVTLQDGNNTIRGFDAPQVEGYVADSLAEITAIIKSTEEGSGQVSYTVVDQKGEKTELTESLTVAIRYAPVTDQTPTVQYVDEAGKELQAAGDLRSLKMGAVLGLEELPQIEGYTLQSVRYRDKEIVKIRRTNYTNYRQEDRDIVYHYQDAEGEGGVLEQTETVTFVYAPAAEHEHSWDEGKVTVEPTCTEKGVKTYTCATCGETKTEDLEALGHKWDEGKVTTEPTCTEKGVKTYTCAACGETKTEELEALGHKWDEGKVTTEPTCAKAGEKVYTCAACGSTKVEELPALGHKYEGGICKTCGERQADFRPKLVEGNSATAYHGTDFVLRSDAAFQDFQKVLLDEKELDKANYTVKEGSTVVTIKGDYISKLSTGEHKIAIVSASGTAYGTFKVSDRVKTGDANNLRLWIALLSASALCAGGTALYVRRKSDAK